MTLFRKSKFGHGMDTARVEAFSDGVFAIAITLLILGVTVPELRSNQTLTNSVLDLWPKVLSYFTSFAVIGIFWVGHHIMFNYIKRADRNFLWLNILFLSIISFFPFPVALIGQYHRDKISLIVYGATLTLAGLAFGAMWLYASHEHRLITANLPDRIIRLGRRVVFMAPLVYAAAVLISFFNTSVTLTIYILVPLLYIWPSQIDELMEYAESEESED